MQKILTQNDQGPKYRAKTRKFFVENIGVNLQDLGFGNRFLDIIPEG